LITLNQNVAFCFGVVEKNKKVKLQLWGWR
jgi:hypothetical protein